MKKEVSKEKKIRRRKRRILIFGILFLLLFSGIFIGNRWARAHGFTSFWDFITTTGSNYVSSWNANYETAEITISESDFNKLQSQRDLHLANGMITKIPDRYVPAIISYNGKKIKSKIRLKGHMTDHLQNNKWSFRVKTVGGDAFQGMRIFSMMHPGTRNYIYEWIYHQLLNKENIATVRYSFIKLKVNGNDWGIYAVEENFGKELVQNNKLPKGPILGLNPDLYWYARYNEHKKIRVDLENLNIGASFPEAYDEEENFKDKESRSNYAKAVIKLERFRRGISKTSETFDIEKLAKFHAILDLVGGQFSLDWSDVKYYYNPVTEKLEPVGYESFSVRNSDILCGSSRFKRKHDFNSEWHEYLFSDPIFYAEYLKQLKKVSKVSYLNSFFSSIEPELENNLAILYKEFPYKKMILDQYFINQKNILALLNQPINPVVYFNEFKNDSLYFTCGNNALHPLQINSIDLGDTIIKLNEPIYFSSRSKNQPIIFEPFSVFYNGKFQSKKGSNLELTFSYPGLSQIKNIKAKPIPFTVNFTSDEFKEIEPNIHNFDFIRVDDELKEIYFLAGNHKIDSDLIIPKGYKVKAILPLSLDLVAESSILSFSPFDFIGTEENPLRIFSSDSSGKGVCLLNVDRRSTFQNVQFENIGRGFKKSDSRNANLLLYKSKAIIKHCIFSSKSQIGLLVIKSQVLLSGSRFLHYSKSALSSSFSKINISNVEFENNIKNALKFIGSNGSVNKIYIKSSITAIQLENNSFFRGSDWKIYNAETAVLVNDHSFLKIDGINITNTILGFQAEKKSDLYGAAAIEVTNFKMDDLKKIKKHDSKSKILIH